MRERKRSDRTQARAEKAKERGTALLPKKLARRLHGLGININRYLVPAPVSLIEYGDLQRQLEAKTTIIEEGYKLSVPRLYDEIRQLHALIQAQAGFLLETDKEAIQGMARQSLEEPAPVDDGPMPPSDLRRFITDHRQRRLDDAKRQ